MLTAAVLTSTVAVAAEEPSEQVKRMDAAATVLDQIMGTPDKGIPEADWKMRAEVLTYSRARGAFCRRYCEWRLNHARQRRNPHSVRSKDEPTADQQKENRSDRDITQQIRQSIMKDRSLSTYAHNVKIITQNGQVTLKGPVGSEDEKRAIEAKATEVAGENKVTSQWDIKPQH